MKRRETASLIRKHCVRGLSRAFHIHCCERKHAGRESRVFLFPHYLGSIHLLCYLCNKGSKNHVFSDRDSCQMSKWFSGLNLGFFHQAFRLFFRHIAIMLLFLTAVNWHRCKAYVIQTRRRERSTQFMNITAHD